ncbi:MAG: biotin transporter BioY [Lachnospiraceae bacterium]|nr:biotin transporter BioY [Lachnospiraceae bacterium]
MTPKKQSSISHHHDRTGSIVFIALFAVLMSVCAWISIPTTVPFTMQTFAVFLALNVLGSKKGTVSICIYLLLGTMGIPVFSSGTTGLGVLLGTNGGYMISWIFAGLVMGILEKLMGRKLWAQAVSMLTGLVVCYVFGTAWFMLVYAGAEGNMGLWAALSLCVFPFILPDLIKLGLVLWISKRLKRLRVIGT